MNIKEVFNLSLRWDFFTIILIWINYGTIDNSMLLFHFHSDSRNEEGQKNKSELGDLWIQPAAI